MLLKNILIVLIFYLLLKGSYLLLTKEGAEINIVDVGQGDAIYIRTKNGRKIIIDGGPNYELDNFLQERSILGNCTVDLVILTHPHADHVKGLNRLIKRCQVKQVLNNIVSHDSKVYKAWLEGISSYNAKQVKAGDTFVVDGLTFIVLWPQGYYGSSSKKKNNSSIVVLLDYGPFEALFMGDLEADASSKIDLGLIEGYLDGRLELYKVPHQGARDAHNVGLVKYLMPEVCVISVGNNSFGHPHEEVVNSLRGMGCDVRKTSEEGTIKISLD